jgi:L-ribulose-5-phosphate 3-epimerase
MNLHGHDIAVCSWSLQPDGIAHLVELTKQLGLGHVQLALGPLVMLDDKRKYQELGHLKRSGLTITAGMINFPGEDYSSIDAIRRTGGYVPDEEWPVRKRLSVQAAQLAAELVVRKISTHIGFVPAEGDPAYDAIKSRVRQVAEVFKSHDIDLLLETGQEGAEELLAFLHDVQAPNVFINFDPANMILYGLGDPIPAMHTLAPFIRHVHVKDATPSANPRTDWGEEVPFGEGQVGPSRFLAELKSIHYDGPLAIEREAGNDRVGDVRKAVDALRGAAAAVA